MSKYAKLIAFDIAMVVAIVIHYLLGLLAFRPANGIFLQAGFIIIFAVVILTALILVNAETLHAHKYGRLEMTGGLIAILNRYTDRPIVGEYAAFATSELQSSERIREEARWPHHHTETTRNRIRITHG